MSNQDPGTTPNAETRAAEEAEAGAQHRADQVPTAEEEQAAPDRAAPGTAGHYEEMVEKGAQVQGEGELP